MRTTKKQAVMCPTFPVLKCASKKYGAAFTCVAGTKRVGCPLHSLTAPLSGERPPGGPETFSSAPDTATES